MPLPSGASALEIFWVVLKATLLSTGGTGNLPALHQEVVVARSWASEGDMAESLGLGQLAPGPTGLWVVCLGYFVGGVPGALLSAAAVALPPFLILGVERVYRRVSHHPAIEGFVQGLGLAVIGISAVILSRLISAATGPLWLKLAFAVSGFALLASRRVSVPIIILTAAIAAIAAALLRQP
jgi:Chromate transport protein ChrA